MKTLYTTNQINPFCVQYTKNGVNKTLYVSGVSKNNAEHKARIIDGHNITINYTEPLGLR